MMTRATASWPSFRLCFTYPGALDDPHLEEQLRLGELTFVQRREQADLKLVEWQSTDPEYAGSVTLAKSRDVEEVGCVYFSGPHRVDLAMSLVRIIQYMPVGVLHLIGRENPDRALRVESLKALAQMHLAEEGGSYWNTTVANTVRHLLREPDAELRRHALFIELTGNPGSARKHILELLEAEPNPEERRQLEGLLKVTDKVTTKDQEASTEESATEPELRLALPIVQDAPVDDMLERFDSSLRIVQDMTADLPGGARLVEFEADDMDASMILVMPQNARIGCLYCSGQDASDLVFSVAQAFAFLPPELAKEVLRSGRQREFRKWAIQALALRSSTRILPSKGMDPEIRSLLQSALSDPDPEIRGMAVNARLLLHDEL